MTATTTPLAAAERAHIIGRALAAAYTYIPGHWIRQAPRRPRIVEGFTNAAAAARAVLADSGIKEADLDSRTAEALHALDLITEGTDPRGGSFNAQARAASENLAYALALTFGSKFGQP